MQLGIKGGLEIILQNCQKCGALYVMKVRKYCPECCTALDEIYRKIRSYMEMFPEATPEELIQALAIDESTLRYLRQEDRITLI